MTGDLSTSEYVQYLRVLAGSEPDVAVRQELFEAANSLEQVLARTRFAQAPTRDQMQRALWGAENSVAEQLRNILDVAQDTHVQMQDLHSAVPKLFRLVEEAQADIKKLRAGQTTANRRLTQSDHRHSVQWQQAMELIGELTQRIEVDEGRLDAKRARIDQLEAQIAELRGPSLPPEQRRRYVEILMRMIQEWDAAHPDESSEAGS